MCATPTRTNVDLTQSQCKSARDQLRNSLMLRFWLSPRGRVNPDSDPFRLKG